MQLILIDNSGQEHLVHANLEILNLQSSTAQNVLVRMIREARDVARILGPIEKEEK